jgi:hypothetical protein
MVERTFNMTKHCWIGRGGPRGLVTHVWDRVFHAMLKEMESGGMGRYKITFERIGDILEGVEDAIS